MFKILVSLLVAFLLIGEIRSECCKFKSFSGSCCGFGKCNIFCCNCDSVTISGRRFVCRPSDTCNFSLQAAIKTVQDLIKAGKQIKKGRAITDIHTNNKFNSIDSNLDGLISLEETIGYFNKTNPSEVRNGLEVIKIKFNEMDQNKDGFLQSEEFDENLKR